MNSDTRYQSKLALFALGVVFGDIGTSPLYALQGTFNPEYGVSVIPRDIIGECSCIFWALMIIVTLKYVMFILRATNKGEGGIMALLALVLSILKDNPKVQAFATFLGLCGAALFYGDSILTPSISVLSAVEGLNVISTGFENYVVVLAILILFGLFMLQHLGTEFIGRFFGPICVVWFLAIGLIGLINIIQQPEILIALNPFYAITFLLHHGWSSFWALGAVLLAFTGVEALYADVGHFGRKAIRLAWYFVFPALALNYLGQGALLINSPEAIRNPFYLACPSWSLYPMIVIATMATVIASQAVISGAFSITWQAVQLHWFPRMKVQYTSSQEKGQIYMPTVNWILFATIVLAIINFRSSANLTTAYGVAVAGTMLITTILSFFVVRYHWKYSLGLSLLIVGFFAFIDSVFFSASLLKFLEGGWFPIGGAVVLFFLMRTWQTGRKIVISRREESRQDLTSFVSTLVNDKEVKHVPGTAIFFCQLDNNVPHALTYNLKHNHVLHKQVLFLHLVQEDTPTVPDKRRIKLKKIEKGCYTISARFGFKEEPNLAKILKLCAEKGLESEDKPSCFLSYENLLLNPRRKGMMPWRKRIFVFLVRNQRNVADYFKISSDQVMQVGAHIDI
jgi:KUP system potassium uptake protein